LRLAVLFGLERAALALGHHANLDASYGLFPTLGLLDIARLGLALVLVGGFWTGCIADSGASSTNRRTTRTVPLQQDKPYQPPHEAQSTTDTPEPTPTAGAA
jgi:hypothetical protein